MEDTATAAGLVMTANGVPTPPFREAGNCLTRECILIDLSRWFLGDFSKIEGFAHTYYWDMPVDDNGFMLLRTPTQQTAFLHVSCTEWKNTFSLEIYGEKGQIAD